MAIRLALATEDFGQPLRQAVRQAAQFRVQGLRLNARTEIGAADLTDTGLRQLRHFVEEHQLKVAGLYCPSRHSVADPQDLDRRLLMIRSAIERVRRLGCTEVLILRVGFRIRQPRLRRSLRDNLTIPRWTPSATRSRLLRHQN